LFLQLRSGLAAGAFSYLKDNFMSTVVIRVKSGVSQTTLNDRLRIDSSRAPDAVGRLSAWFHALAGGIESASVSIQTGAADPVRSSQTATIVFVSLLATDTVTISGTVLTCTTSAPSANQFQRVTDATVSAANLAAAINSQATLLQLVSATSSGAVVTISANYSGIIGNLITVATSSVAGVVLGGSVLAGGAGGPGNAPITYSRGL